MFMRRTNPTYFIRQKKEKSMKRVNVYDSPFP